MKDTVFARSNGSGQVLDPKDGSNECWGVGKCIPHSRCVAGDLLSPDGTLTIKVKIDLLGENCPGGIQNQSEVKCKLNKLNTELGDIKSKLRKIEENQAGEVSSSPEKCPMCMRVVRKPMRLQQCPRVRSGLSLLIIISVILNTRVTSSVMTVTTTSRGLPKGRTGRFFVSPARRSTVEGPIS